jgi:hypothetical protein
MVERFMLKVIMLHLLMLNNITTLLAVEVPLSLKETSLMSTTVPWMVTKLYSMVVTLVVEVED